MPEKDSIIAVLMDDVELIRQQLTSSNPVLVTGNQTEIAYKLAMETLVSEISISMPPADLHKRKTCCSDDDHKKKKESCGICFEDGFEAEQMFYVAVCRHQFCVECMKRYLRVCLLTGCALLTCPHDGCNSKLTIKSCANLLELKLRTVWEERNKDDSKKINPWRECKKCQHMTEYDYDDSQVTCRYLLSLITFSKLFIIIL